MTTVMLVEKDLPHVKLMAWALSEGGLDVTTTTEIEDARDAPPDVLVFNTGMPVDAKRAWIGGFRYLAPKLKIIDLVSKNDNEPHDSGADAYLKEPFAVEELLTIMESLLGKPVRGNTPASTE